MHRIPHDSNQKRLKRLEEICAVLACDEKSNQGRSPIGWVILTSALVSFLAMFIFVNSLALQPATASSKIQRPFSLPMPDTRPSPLPRPNAITRTGQPVLPVIALVIDDIGPARQWSQMALELPTPVSLSVLPYVKDAADWALRAQASGHEVLLHMPMEPFGLEDPGPGALLERLPRAQNRQRLATALGRVPGVIGINNHMGSRFTSCAWCMAEVADLLQDRGMMFLDSVTSQKSIAARMVGKAGGAIIKRDIFLDDLDTPDAIALQMRRAENLATEKGVVVVIAHPRKDSLAALQSWPQRLAKKGIRLVPLSVALKRRRALERGVGLRSAGL